jgi:RNA polymerase-binding transcription factor
MDERVNQELAQLRDELAQKLRQQRRELLKNVAETEADLRAVETERAQQTDAARLFARLDDRHKQQIEEIDQALTRIALGTYGSCERSGQPIPIARLRALPTARFHVQCLSEEEGLPGTPEEEESPIATREESAVSAEEERAPPDRMPIDLNALSDEEVEDYLRQQLRADGRVDMDELQIVFRQGAIHLDGALPSEAQHQILLQYVADFAGVEEVVDRLVVNELLWEREDRTEPPPPEEPQAEAEPEGTEDIVESEQEGIDYEPPAGPTQERS